MTKGIYKDIELTSYLIVNGWMLFPKEQGKNCPLSPLLYNYTTSSSQCNESRSRNKKYPDMKGRNKNVFISRQCDHLRMKYYGIYKKKKAIITGISEFSMVIRWMYKNQFYFCIKATN